MKKISQINRQKYRQYFTPPHVAKFMLDLQKILDPEFFYNRVSVMDPACGEGVFLKIAIEEGITEPKKCYGIDADPIMRESWSKNKLLEKMGENLQIGDALAKHYNTNFDLSVGNPPFGLIQINEENIYNLTQFDVFHAYMNEKRGRKNPSAFPIEILFLEKFIKSTRMGGLISIVIPEGILANIKMRYVRKWISSACTPIAIISLDSRVFQATGVSARTSILFLRRENNVNKKKTDVIMAKADNVDPRGKSEDDLDGILCHFMSPLSEGGLRGEKKDESSFKKNPDIFVVEFKDMEIRWDPDFHHPWYAKYFEVIKKTKFPVKPLGKFMSPSQIFTAYKGPQCKACTDDKIHYITSRQITDLGIDHTRDNSFIDRGNPCDTKRTRIREGDILLVRSGEGCIGRAVVAGSEYAGSNVRSEIYILRPDPHILNPYYIVAFLLCFRVPFKKRKVHFQIARLCSGVGTPNLNKEEILSVMIPYLPIKEQEKIEKEYREIQKIYHKGVTIKEKIINENTEGHDIENDERYMKCYNEACCRMRIVIEYMENKLKVT